MKAKRQNFKDKQLKDFLLELEKLSKKYGIVLSVPAKSVYYGNIKNLEYHMGEEYTTRIYSKNVEYETIKVDINKRYNLKPSDNCGFYMFTERELDDPLQALEHWQLVHSLITQISGVNPKVIRDYMDDMGYQTWYWIFRKNAKTQIDDMTKIYINWIDHHITQYLDCYERLKGLE